MEYTPLRSFTSEKLTMHEPHETTPALPRAAIVRQGNALMKCCVQQYFAWIGGEGRVVGGNGEFSCHPRRSFSAG
jgi:hypothetical protein